MAQTILAQQEHPLTDDTKLVVSHGTWRKKDYVDVRTHWKAPSGEWFPTKKGVRLDTDLAQVLTDNIREMLGITPTNGNGNGNHPASPAWAVPQLHVTPSDRPSIAPDLSILTVLRDTAEHILAGSVLEKRSWGREVRHFSAQMGGRFRRPDAPYTAIFSPLMRKGIESEIERVRNSKRSRKPALRREAGVYCWDMSTVATAQHPNHPHGASYCDKCQPYSDERMQAIARRAQECIGAGISHDPLPDETFAWRREMNARSAKQAKEYKSKYGTLA